MFRPICQTLIRLSTAATLLGVDRMALAAPTVTDAAIAAALQSGHAAQAASMSGALVRSHPKDANAWLLLGVALLKTKSYDGAAAACRKSLAIEPNQPQVLYSLGVIYALKHEHTQAFIWLRKARATWRLDMTQIEFDANLASLRRDPRFTALLPKTEDFAHPFVEPVKVIREWDGEAANDQFGWIARNMGDVDGDGVNDVVTSAPTNNAGGKGAGRVYVYSTRAGKRLWMVDGHAGDGLGTGLECAGDTNGDGVADVIAGAPNANKVLVLSGRDGHVLLTLKGEHKADSFGQHCEGCGDVDGDGCADVIVGAPSSNAGGTGAGRAYVYSGRGGRLLLTLTGARAGDAFGSSVAGHTDANGTFLVVGAPGAGSRKTGRVYVYDGLNTKPKFVIDSDATGRALGSMFVSVVGDVDGDGRLDIYASDYPNAARGPSTGRIYVRSGRDGHNLTTLTGSTTGEGFGIGPANAGDVDGDGHADLIVGSWQYAGSAISGGRATLFSGKDGHVLKTFTCRTPGDTFGFDATGMGDVDGDGIDDLLITSAWSGIHGYHSGRMFIVSSGIHHKL